MKRQALKAESRLRSSLKRLLEAGRELKFAALARATLSQASKPIDLFRRLGSSDAADGLSTSASALVFFAKRDALVLLESERVSRVKLWTYLTLSRAGPGANHYASLALDDERLAKARAWLYFSSSALAARTSEVSSLTLKRGRRLSATAGETVMATAAALKPRVAAAEQRALALLHGPRVSRARALASRSFTRKAVSETRAKVSVLLSRQVLTASDKKTLYELKSKIIYDSTSRTAVARARAVMAYRGLKGRVLNERTVGAMRFARAQAGRVSARAVVTSLDGASRRLALLVPPGVSGIFLTAGNKRRYLAIKEALSIRYAGLRLWLRKPVTVGTVIGVMSVWALAITFIRFEFPWSEIGYTSGYGAILLTAAMTAKLTVNSERLWLERPHTREASKEAAKEVNAWIIQTALARRSLVLHEIEEFLASGLDGRVKEVNLKANAFLMRRKDWQALQDALYDTFLRGAPPLLFELGHRLGASVGRDLMRLGEKPLAIMSQLEEVSRTLGWGIVSVHGDLARGARLTFDVRESPFCVAETQLEKNTRSCHMLVGMVTGIAEEVYGWPCSSSEQRCVRDGHECCRIVVTPAMVPVHREKWNLSVLFPVLHPWSQ